MRFQIQGYGTVYTTVARIDNGGVACVKGQATILRWNRKRTAQRSVLVETVARIEDVTLVADVTL